MPLNSAPLAVARIPAVRIVRAAFELAVGPRDTSWSALLEDDPPALRAVPRVLLFDLHAWVATRTPRCVATFQDLVAELLVEIFSVNATLRVLTWAVPLSLDFAALRAVLPDPPHAFDGDALRAALTAAFPGTTEWAPGSCFRWDRGGFVAADRDAIAAALVAAVVRSAAPVPGMVRGALAGTLFVECVGATPRDVCVWRVRTERASRWVREFLHEDTVPGVTPAFGPVVDSYAHTFAAARRSLVVVRRIAAWLELLRACDARVAPVGAAFPRAGEFVGPSVDLGRLGVVACGGVRRARAPPPLLFVHSNDWRVAFAGPTLASTMLAADGTPLVELAAEPLAITEDATLLAWLARPTRLAVFNARAGHGSTGCVSWVAALAVAARMVGTDTDGVLPLARATRFLVRDTVVVGLAGRPSCWELRLAAHDLDAACGSHESRAVLNATAGVLHVAMAEIMGIVYPVDIVGIARARAST